MLRSVTFFVGFYHEEVRLDRDNFVDIDFEAIKEYEIAKYGQITNKMRKQFIRCDESIIGQKKVNYISRGNKKFF